MNPIIQVKDVMFRYEGEDNPSPVLDGVSLEIDEGKFVVILGHNGSGKWWFDRHGSPCRACAGGRWSPGDRQGDCLG